MKMNICYNILICVLAIFFSLHVRAQELASKKVTKSVDFIGMNTLQIDNKHGDITINGWPKNNVQIEINITVERKEKNKAEELLSRIKPLISKSQGTLKIKSDIEEKSASILSRLWVKNEISNTEKSNLKIDYTIYAPINSELNISNQFGDFILNDWNGKLNASIEHGNIWINEEIKQAIIQMKFAKMKAQNIKSASLTLNNSETNLYSSEKLNINSNGSTIKIHEAKIIIISSNKDNIDVKHLQQIQGESRFSNITIKELSSKIDLSTVITDLKIEHITETNPEIKISQKSSDIQIQISGLHFDFTAQLEEGLLRIPKSFKNVKSNMISTLNRLRNIEGLYQNKGPKGTIQIFGKKGIITLKE